MENSQGKKIRIWSARVVLILTFLFSVVTGIVLGFINYKETKGSARGLLYVGKVIVIFLGSYIILSLILSMLSADWIGLMANIATAFFIFWDQSKLYEEWRKENVDEVPSKWWSATIIALAIAALEMLSSAWFGF